MASMQIWEFTSGAHLVCDYYNVQFLTCATQSGPKKVQVLDSDSVLRAKSFRK